MSTEAIIKNLTRRKFFFQGSQALAQFAVANVGLYLIGSAFKGVDGSLVAGAKCSGPMPSCWGNYCATGNPKKPNGHMCEVIPTCVGNSWVCKIPSPGGGYCQPMDSLCF